MTGGNIDIELPLPENKPNEEVDASIFESLNLDYPGLEKVKMHYEAGEHYYASLALLDYYRTRTNVTNPDLSLIDVKATETEMGQANAAMDNYRFYVKGFEDPKAPGMPYSVKKDGAINWQNNPAGVTDEYQKQLHRHQWFIPQGKAYRMTGDEKYFESWKEVYSDWVKQNPQPAPDQIGQGSWWQLQVSARIVDQTKLLEYFKSAQGFTPEYITLFLKSFAEQADFLAKYLHSDGNILLSQGNALVSAGILFPEFKNAEQWMNKGFDILNAEQKKQFLPDGWHFELSQHYHVGCVDYYYEAMRLANYNQKTDKLSADFVSSLRKATEVVMNFTFPNYFKRGSDNIVPMFNDSFSRTRSIRKKNFKSYCDMFPDNEELRYMYTGANGATPQGTCPDTEMRIYPDAGYYVMRNGWTPASTVMMLSNNVSDNLSRWSHNQPDNGTFELYINGRNFFPDSGVFRYSTTNGDNSDRDWFRGTDKHNTLTQKDMRYPEKDLKKNINKCDGKTLKSEAKEGTELVVFENQGYEDLKHRRAVFFVNKEFFVLVDEAIGTTVNPLYLSFNLCPEEKAGDVVIDMEGELGCHTAFKDNNNILVRTFTEEGKAISVKTFEGRLSYDTSDKEYIKRPAYTIYYEGKQTDENPRFITVIRPVSSASGKTVSAKFTDDGQSENGARLQVTVDGQTYNLAYTL